MSSIGQPINIVQEVMDSVKKAKEELGHINILIAGRSGVGKSTLINSVFNRNLAETGQGRPVTQHAREINRPDMPVTIIDTRGIEMAGFSSTMSELEELLVERKGDVDSNRHVHVAWLCIQEDSRRVEDAEIQLHEMLAKHVPLITVITKSRADSGFKQQVLSLLPKSKNAMRVRAISEQFDDGYSLPSFGLKELIELTSDVLPEGKRTALAASQKASLDLKRTEARKAVAYAASAAATAGAVPIPFADAAVIAPIQVAMIARISIAFGLEISTESMISLLGGALGVGAASLAGRTIVTNLIKFIPGVGAVVGGAISATTAASLTVALGEAYIASIVAILEEDGQVSLNDEKIAEVFREKLSQTN